MDWVELIELVLIGLASGVLGGLLGIGGSVIIIPILTILLHRNIHLAQAAAMIVNVFVAVPATLQHSRAGKVQWPVVWKMLPVAVIFIIIGVEAGNATSSLGIAAGADGRILEGIFGVFLLYVVIINILRLFDDSPRPDPSEARTGWIRVSFVGSLVGFASGLLGIGGGTLTVPLFQRVCKLGLRRCIATSSAVMCLTAAVGAIRKNGTLHAIDGNVPLTLDDSLLLAACLAPTAFIGGLIGARLTHKLPRKQVRAALVVLLTLASARMLYSSVTGS